MQLTLHASTSDYTIASSGRCLCQIGHRVLGASAWQTFSRVAEKVAADVDGRLLVLTIVEVVPTAAEGEHRAGAESYARAVENLVARSAVVVESGGFQSALVRSIITGMAVLLRRSYPRRVFSSVSDAAWWLREGAEPAFDPRDLLAALEQLRRRIAQQNQVA